ncbi:hypothetical protein APS56_01160 [Pseudalgibacter alginicilyticus]|uniref:DUF4365 domain-containing protein n=1 Tax=Pseudalgibacter alginicilyticus TaxID=1736674 RepID=A0A0P0D240_9FLAO|nr:DUF4365 domain-containing protein [Pseudalgibacter alginicilyticus]ALJ03842.1 hypothetical protein APS56_01160 [Pseudalgibacter alginicilyticus]
MRDINTERIGVYATALLITKELDWIFREQPIVDVGIDALIEQKLNGEPTGKFISAQIKTGKGNFHDSKNSLTLYVTKIHYNYWLNSNLPVIIIAHLPETDKTTWEIANEETFKKTPTQWKILIPKSKNLNENSIDELNKIISGNKQTDFELQVQNGELSQSEIDQIVEDAGLFSECIKSLNTISDLISKLGEETKNQRIKIDKFVDQGLSEFDKRVKKSVKVYSESMNSITYKLNAEIEEFAYYFAKVFSAQEKVSIIVYHIEQDYATLQDLLDSLINLKPNMRESIESMKFLRNSVSGLPKNNAHLKKARLKFLEVSNQIIKEFKLAKNINNSFIETLNEKLG